MRANIRGLHRAHDGVRYAHLSVSRHHAAYLPFSRHQGRGCPDHRILIRRVPGVQQPPRKPLECTPRLLGPLRQFLWPVPACQEPRGLDEIPHEPAVEGVRHHRGRVGGRHALCGHQHAPGRRRQVGPALHQRIHRTPAGARVTFVKASHGHTMRSPA